MALIEAVPNISEGRRADVIDACVAAVARGGASLLDLHVDPDHNRSVLTFAGTPDRVRASALSLAETAMRHIDLRGHAGVHPRMGSLDVLPFVPLEAVTLADAAALATDVASELGRRGLPVYLYGVAATRSGRTRLEHVRSGGFETLGTRMADPEWLPDFGPSTPHPSAGASAVGARGFLVAYNVVLATDQLAVAQAMARRVRERDGGLPGVKALGLRLASRGLVQVSLNLTDVRRATPLEVFDRIAAEAAAAGVTVLESELVGLAPAATLPPHATTRLRLAGPARPLTIEAALARAGLRDAGTPLALPDAALPR